MIWGATQRVPGALLRSTAPVDYARGVTTYSVIWIGLSLVSLGCLAYGVVVRGLCPRWLLLVAAVPPLAVALFAGYSYWLSWNAGSALAWQYLAGHLYGLLAAGFLALAALVPGAGAARPIACLLALAIPAPLMVMILLLMISLLGDPRL